MRIAFCLLVAAFAGCLDSVDLDEDAYELHASGVPARALAGSPFIFQLEADGDVEGASQHIGGHYWAQSTTDPDADFAAQAGACEHLSGARDLPGAFEITCTVSSPGTVYLRGHVRVETDGQTYNYWSDEFAVEAVDLELHTENGAATAEVGQEYTFDLHIEGESEASSNHIGAHYWTEPTDDPTADFADQAGACQHQGGDVPAVLTVTCTWTDAGTYHVYGHLRLGEQRPLDLWAEPLVVEVVEVS